MTLEDINKNGVMSLDISEVTAEDLDVLYEYYANILKASKEKVEQLRSEVKESWSVIDGLEADEKKYAIAGDEKAYMKARYRHDMHKERIAAHESKLVDLEKGHLIETREYQKMLGMLRWYSNKASNESAADFMECVHALEQVCADYEAKMKPVHKLGKLLQEDVYRKREQFDPEKIEPYSSRLGYDCSSIFRSVTKVISARNQPHSVNYGIIRNKASNVLKARIAAGYPGLEDKARRYAAGDQDGRPWPKDQKDQAKEVLESD